MSLEKITFVEFIFFYTRLLFHMNCDYIMPFVIVRCNAVLFDAPAFGFRYPLEDIDIKICPDGKIYYTDATGLTNEIQTVMTVNVGQTQGR